MTATPATRPTPETCPRLAGAERRGAPVFRPAYAESVVSIRDEALGHLTRTGLCFLCGAAIYQDYSGGLWHATAEGMVQIPDDRQAGACHAAV